MYTIKLSRSGGNAARAGGAIAIATAVAVAGLGTATPAQSAETTDCPEAFPESALVADQPVTGLTVTSGTTPSDFTGTVLGVLDNGIATGIDMIMVELTSPEVDRVGIWQGMSGSPVYAEDGRLIGAVSYGLAFGPSPVAGVTPAADMQKVLSEGARPGVLRARRSVTLPKELARLVAATDGVTAEQARSGMSQLRLPLGVAGLGNQKRLDQFADRAADSDVSMTRMGVTAHLEPATPTSILPGGNLAAAISYGDITAAAVGTTTMVCGDEVVGFGHPMAWSGPSQMSMHEADAIYIQQDPTVAGFKVANIGPPVGTVDQDRMAGIGGVLGTLPDAGEISTDVTSGDRSRSGTTYVNLPDWMPDLGFGHVISNLDSVFDGVGKGGGTMTWTVQGRREDDSPFTFTRSDLYADPYDITYAMAGDVANSLATLEYNGIEDITLDSVHAEADVERAYMHATVRNVFLRTDRAWKRVSPRGVLRLRAGERNKLRVGFVRSDKTTGSVVVTMGVKRRERGSMGYLDVLGGNSYYSGGDEEEFAGPSSSGNEDSFDALLTSMRRTPHHDDAVVTLNLFGGSDVSRRRKTPTGTVLDGGLSVEVRIVG